MKSLSRYFAIGILLIICSGFFSDASAAEKKDPASFNPLLGGTNDARQYLVQISGTVMNETFSRSQALLTLMAPPPPGGNMRYINPYQIIVEGFPKKNSRNSFFWNSESSEMTAIASEITCDIKRTFVKGVEVFFIFLSPSLLLSPTGALDVLAGASDAGKKAAERVALPTHIPATAGKLKLRIQTDTVSGTVWMKGYDPVEKAFVMYSARLYGKRSYNLQPKQQGQKGTTAGEE